MGLMLSVLVFCVGVAEVLDCWHHFLLHLVQPQYNPLPYPLDAQRDILSEKELYPYSDSRRPSHVDICWPKDLSPTDDLHVIKKRPHNESERNLDYDGETCSSPQVVGCCPDSDCNRDQNSPTGSWNTSPNHLELSIITESESSSDTDETSQIENLAYKSLNCSNSSSKKDKLADELPRDQSTIIKRSNEIEKEDGIKRVNPSSSSFLADNATKNTTYPESITREKSNPTNTPEGTISPDLPVFTGNILSTNVKKVSGRYPSDNVLPSSLDIEQTCTRKNISDELTESRERNLNNLSKVDVISSLPNNERTASAENQSISSILDEGLEPIPEFPEIRLSESSPIPPEQSSESSLNTSDDSWIAKNKTSDRPLLVRLSQPSQQIQKNVEPVTQTDLQTFDNKVVCESSESSVSLPEEVICEEDNIQNVVLSEDCNHDLGSISDVRQPHDTTKPHSDVSNVTGECVFNENKILLHPDTNSSSSSLSGIPQLPEDPNDMVRREPLPTDNGYGSGYFGSDKRSTNVSNVNDVCDQVLAISDRHNSEQINSALSSEEVKDEVLENEITKEYQSSSQLLLGAASKEELISPYHDHNSFEKLKSTSSQNSGSLFEENSENENKEIEKNLPDPHLTKIMPEDQFNTPKDEESTTSSKGWHEVKNTNSSPGNAQKVKEILKTTSGNSKDSSLLDEKNKSQEKDNSSKKRRSKRSSRDSFKTTPEVESPMELCQAKESDEEDHADSRVQTSCVRSSPPLSAAISSEKEVPSRPEPAKPAPVQQGATPSTSKADAPENKAFWLIFSGEYTKAMNKDWHSGHFCCWQCDESLTGQRYVLRDEHPYCIKCYESVFANGCEECNKTIGIDSKDLSYKDKHWHEACFLCNKCRVSLVDKQFGSKLDKIFCGNCYDAQFASRCDGCGQIFKAGTKKMEYKTRQWHEPCFACCVCKTAIGTKSFIPREQEIYCATCYEEKFATRCVKCNKIITSGGVTYKNEPWHRECFTCTNCSASLAGQRFTSRDEKPYCAECFGELFAKRCTACSKPITGIGGTRFISFEDRHWHNDCFICASCQTSLVGRGFITDADEIICPECAKQKLM